MKDKKTHHTEELGRDSIEMFHELLDVRDEQNENFPVIIDHHSRTNSFHHEKLYHPASVDKPVKSGKQKGKRNMQAGEFISQTGEEHSTREKGYGDALNHLEQTSTMLRRRRSFDSTKKARLKSSRAWAGLHSSNDEKNTHKIKNGRHEPDHEGFKSKREKISTHHTKINHREPKSEASKLRRKNTRQLKNCDEPNHDISQSRREQNSTFQIETSFLERDHDVKNPNPPVRHERREDPRSMRRTQTSNKNIYSNGEVIIDRKSSYNIRGNNRTTKGIHVPKKKEVSNEPAGDFDPIMSMEVKNFSKSALEEDESKCYYPHEYGSQYCSEDERSYANHVSQNVEYSEDDISRVSVRTDASQISRRKQMEKKISNSLEELQAKLSREDGIKNHLWKDDTRIQTKVNDPSFEEVSDNFDEYLNEERQHATRGKRSSAKEKHPIKKSSNQKHDLESEPARARKNKNNARKAVFPTPRTHSKERNNISSITVEVRNPSSSSNPRHRDSRYFPSRHQDSSPSRNRDTSPSRHHNSSPSRHQDTSSSRHPDNTLSNHHDISSSKHRMHNNSARNEYTINAGDIINDHDHFDDCMSEYTHNAPHSPHKYTQNIPHSPHKEMYQLRKNHGVRARNETDDKRRYNQNRRKEDEGVGRKDQGALDDVDTDDCTTDSQFHSNGEEERVRPKQKQSRTSKAKKIPGGRSAKSFYSELHQSDEYLNNHLNAKEKRPTRQRRMVKTKERVSTKRGSV